MGGRALRKTAVFGTVERGGDVRTMAHDGDRAER